MFLRWHYLVDVLAGLTLAITGVPGGHPSRTGSTRRARMGIQPAWVPLRLPGASRPTTEARPAHAWIRDHRHGHYVPGRPVTNDDLSRVMDTNDEWIFQAVRHPAAPLRAGGVGCSDLALEASKRAIEAAGSRRRDRLRRLRDDDARLHFPGPRRAPRAQARLGGVPALDIRQQCAAMLFGLQIVDGLIQTGAANDPLRRRRGARRLHAVGRLGRARPRQRPSATPGGRRARPTSIAPSPSSSVTAPARSSSARPTATRASAA